MRQVLTGLFEKQKKKKGRKEGRNGGEGAMGVREGGPAAHAMVIFQDRRAGTHTPTARLAVTTPL